MRLGRRLQPARPDTTQNLYIFTEARMHMPNAPRGAPIAMP